MDSKKLIACGFNSFIDSKTGLRYIEKEGSLKPLEDGSVGELERKFVETELEKMASVKGGKKR